MEKEIVWKDYYQSYISQAESRNIHPTNLLDQMWTDGKRYADELLCPHITPDSVVLEIACGVGRISRHVAPLCKKLYCTDIIDGALDVCRDSCSAHDNIIFQKISGYDLNIFADEFFDCVYSFTSFFHFDFEIVVAYFLEIKRVLKPGGVALLEFKSWKKKKNIEDLLLKIDSVGGIENYEKELDKWRYVSLSQLELLCDYCNFSILDSDVTKFTFRKNKNAPII